MKTLTKTLGIIGMMTILGTGTMFGSTNVNDKNHKNNGCVVVVNHKFDKNHKNGKDYKMVTKCNCKTCRDLEMKMNDHKSMNMGDKHMEKVNTNDKGMKKENSNHSVNNGKTNNNTIMNGRR